MKFQSLDGDIPVTVKTLTTDVAQGGNVAVYVPGTGTVYHGGSMEGTYPGVYNGWAFSHGTAYSSGTEYYGGHISGSYSAAGAYGSGGTYYVGGTFTGTFSGAYEGWAYGSGSAHFQPGFGL